MEAVLDRSRAAPAERRPEAEQMRPEEVEVPRRRRVGVVAAGAAVSRGVFSASVWALLSVPVSVEGPLAPVVALLWTEEEEEGRTLPALSAALWAKGGEREKKYHRAVKVLITTTETRLVWPKTTRILKSFHNAEEAYSKLSSNTKVIYDWLYL